MRKAIILTMLVLMLVMFNLLTAGCQGNGAEPAPESSIQQSDDKPTSQQKVYDAAQGLQHSDRGKELLSKGYYKEAFAEFNKAIDFNPENADAYGNRGIILMLEGDRTKAIADYNKAIELDPNNAAVYFNRGIAYYSGDELEKAASDFEKCIELSQEADLTNKAQGKLDIIRNEQ
jgi:Flp pilus assembly protein TadD